MSTFESPKAAAAALVFLILYLFYTIAAVNIIRLKGCRSRYSFLTLYGVIRFGGQLCGVVFAALGLAHWQWLIAYLVLGAEGYFVLVLFTFHYLIQAQKKYFGWSWLRPTKEEKAKLKSQKHSFFLKRLAGYISIFEIFHLLLIPANVCIIYGGTSTAGKTTQEIADDPSIITKSRILRTVGQALFLGETLFIVVMAMYVYFVEQIKNLVHLTAIFMVSPFLTIRGIFGILSIYISSMNYYDSSNYTALGLSSQFVTYEYVLGTTMEFISGAILIFGFYWHRRREAAESDPQDCQINIEDSTEKGIHHKSTEVQTQEWN